MATKPGKQDAARGKSPTRPVSQQLHHLFADRFGDAVELVDAVDPYTVIKEANPSHVAGTATGVINFLNFTFSALLGPVFASMLLRSSAGADSMELAHYQTTFQPMLYGVIVAIVLALMLKETGPKARPS